MTPSLQFKTTRYTRRVFSVLMMLLSTLGFSAAGLAVDHTVLVGGTSNVFNPQNLTIQLGDRVIFRNQGGNHNVKENNGLFRCSSDCAGVSGGTGNPSTAAWVFGVQLSAVGTVGYHSENHGGPGTGMHGTIVIRNDNTGPVTIGPGFTGAWYDPQQAGHGLFLEVLPDGRLLAWWFTFAPDGTQSWFGGTGMIEGNRVVMVVQQTTGGRWIPNFNPSQIVNNNWGTLTFTFSSCTSGRVDFSSNFAQYGVGSMNLTRLTIPAGLSCP